MNAQQGRAWKQGLQDRIVLYPHLIGDGRPGSEGGRIVGGTEAVPNSRPYIVTLNIDVLYFCGGTLIGKLFRIFLRASIFGSSCLLTQQ